MYEESAAGKAAGIEVKHLRTSSSREASRPRSGAAPSAGGPSAHLETIVGGVLRYGVVASFLVIALGFTILVRATYAAAPHPGAEAIYPPPQGHAEVLHSPAEVAFGLIRGDPNALVVLGLLVLLGTPIVQVAVSAVTFAMRRDWAYVAITTFVLTVLAISFLVGAAG